MKRYAWDIETNSLLTQKVVDYTSFPYKMRTEVTEEEYDEGKRVATFHCGWVFDVDDKSKRWGFRPGEGHLMVEKLKEADVLVSHNGIDFDHLWIRLMFGASYSLTDEPYGWDTFCGKSVKIIDTLTMSKVLNPDRPNGHSLKSWGRRLGNDKIDYGHDDDSVDCWETFNEDMYVYCEQDVNLTVDVFHSLWKEAGYQDGWEEYWESAFRLEQAIRELVTRQSHFGFDFDKDLAKETVADLNRLLAECESIVIPNLPMKNLPKSKQPNFPAKPFLMSGGFSNTGKKWIVRLVEQGTLDEDSSEDLKRQALQEQWPVVLTEQMKLSNQEDVKSYLVGIGWRPTKWGERDLFTESDKKTASTPEQYKKRITNYINKTYGSPFESYRLLQLNLPSRDDLSLQEKRTENAIKYEWYSILWKKFEQKGKEYKDKVRDYNTGGYKWITKKFPSRLICYTQPKFTVDLDKNLCPNLEVLAEEIPYSKAIVEWLTYRHRRNSIESPNGTGWIYQVRTDDGRIPTPADTMGCNTSRFRHIGVANVPRVSSLYGEPLRALFACGGNYYQIGTDGDAIEARVQGHYIMPYRGGPEEAALLLAPKPNDVHTVTAIALGITRDQAKSIRYAISYGAQPAKIAAMFGWTLKRAKEVFKAFWEQNGATAALKKDLVKQWERNGKRFITGIDGRKLATRTEHSLLNTLFQSCGVIIMKKAHLIVDRQNRKEGYCVDPFEGEPTSMFMCCYHEVRGFTQ